MEAVLINGVHIGSSEEEAHRAWWSAIILRMRLFLIDV